MAKKQTRKRKRADPFAYNGYFLTGNEKLHIAAELAASKLKNTREVEDAMSREIEQIDFVEAMIAAGREDLIDFIMDEVMRIELLCKSRIATSRWPAYAHFA